MKIGITGHSKGIGKSIFDKLTEDGHEVLGFSRSNGFSIENTDSILNQVKDCDVFINNAYAKIHQTNLLKHMCGLWREENEKLIIHLGSKVVFFDNSVLSPSMILYRKEKADQHRWLEQGIKTFCPKVCNLILGYTDTEMAAEYQGNKLDPKHVANAVSNIINNKNEVYTRTLFLDAVTL